LPVGAVFASWLVASGRSREAFSWALWFGAAILVAVASKIAFLGWGLGISAIDFTGVSGHAMLATALLPVCANEAARNVSSNLRLGAVALGYAGGLLIGASRVILGEHSLSEVVFGCVLGALVSIEFLRTAKGGRIGNAAAASAIVIFLAVVFLSAGRHAPSQYWITRAALYLSGHSSPYRR